MKDILIKSYNRDSKAYNKKFKDLQYNKYHFFFHNRSIINNCKTIVDFGCGTALLNNFLIENNIQLDYSGVDLAIDMVKIAQKRTKKVRCEDILKTTYPSNSFDLLTCFTVLRIIDDDEISILKEMKRVLKSQGLLFLSILRHKVDKTLYMNLKNVGFKIIREFSCGQDTGFICKKEENIMDEALFSFKIEKLNSQDIKITGEIKNNEPMQMSTRMFIAEETIPDFITTLQNITPELIADNTHRPIKNNYDDIGFTIESYEYGELLTIANNHLKKDGSIDNYGLLDIPYIFKGIPNPIYINNICNKLKEFIV